MSIEENPRHKTQLKEIERILAPFDGRNVKEIVLILSLSLAMVLEPIPSNDRDELKEAAFELVRSFLDGRQPDFDSLLSRA